MPVIQIDTNLKDADMPANFIVNLHRHLAPIMKKDVAVCIFI
jgi:hypothetical protein